MDPQQFRDAATSAVGKVEGAAVEPISAETAVPSQAANSNGNNETDPLTCELRRGDLVRVSEM